MAWGIWNKIKKGFKKAGAFVKKAASAIGRGLRKVNEKIVKPFMPVIKTAANAILPGAGTAIGVASGAVDRFTSDDGVNVDAVKDGVRGWAKNKGW